MRRRITSIAITTAILGLTGCATVHSDPQDPYEGFNRKVFAFNMFFDKELFKPAAETYVAVTPNFAQAGVSNFFDNIDLIPTVINDVLQLRVDQTLHDTSRLICNSTLGIGGLFDVGSHIGLAPYHNDLGLTFARWGVKNSSYFMIPFWGPSTLRDTIAEPIQYTFMTPWLLINDPPVFYSTFALSKISSRSQYLGADKLVDEAFDPYVFVRSAYLQRRENEIAQLSRTKENPNGAVVPDNNANASTSNTSDNTDTYVPDDSSTSTSNTAATTNSATATSATTTNNQPTANLPTPTKKNN